MLSLVLAFHLYVYGFMSIRVKVKVLKVFSLCSKYKNNDKPTNELKQIIWGHVETKHKIQV